MFTGSTPPSGTPTAGFDFSLHVRRLCRDVAARSEDLGHLDVDRIAVTFSQARKRVLHGLQATLTPMRFDGGSRYTRRGNRRWTIERVFDDRGVEVLYLLNFYLPRYLDLDFREKLVTLFHELWHISPDFNGDLRRFPGRCYAHGHSQRAFDEKASRLADAYLASGAPQHCYQFLSNDFRTLKRKHGEVFGTRYRAPNLIPADGPTDRVA